MDDDEKILYLDKKIEFFNVPSLVQASIVSIVSILWKEKSIRALAAECDYSKLRDEDEEEKFQVINYWVIEKVLSFEIPETVKAKIINFVQPMGLAMIKWKTLYACLFFDYPYIIDIKYVYKLLSKFCWTPDGLVDIKRTVTNIVKDKNICIMLRYKLASIHCLEDYIKPIWTKRLDILGEPHYRTEDINTHPCCIMTIFWHFKLKGNLERFVDLTEGLLRSGPSAYQQVFEYSALTGNKVATEYFLDKLSPEEVSASVLWTAQMVIHGRIQVDGNNDELPKDYYAEVLCLLISQMDVDQQSELFRTFPCDILVNMLDWPYYDVFLDIFRFVQFKLNHNHHSYLLLKLVNRSIGGCNEEDYWRICFTYFLNIPESFRPCIVFTTVMHLTVTSLQSKMYRIRNIILDLFNNSCELKSRGIIEFKNIILLCCKNNRLVDKYKLWKKVFI